MPRPTKPKRICRLPACTAFFSQPGRSEAASVSDTRSCSLEADKVIYLLVEEYEAIRLIDYLGFSQEACAAQMGIARTTVQSLYADGRRKLARFLVEGLHLEIRGGNFALCPSCRQDGGSCQIHSPNISQQGACDKAMKIAVTYENGQVFQHFGHTEAFKIYTVEDGKVLSSQICPTNGSGHGALAGFLRAQGVDTLICGGIGGGARNALAEAGIDLYPGAAGDADAQVLSFLAGKLTYQPDIVCSHHHHEGGQDCGHSGSHHDCGQHHCGHGNRDHDGGCGQGGHHCGHGEKQENCQ